MGGILASPQVLDQHRMVLYFYWLINQQECHIQSSILLPIYTHTQLLTPYIQRNLSFYAKNKRIGHVNWKRWSSEFSARSIIQSRGGGLCVVRSMHASVFSQRQKKRRLVSPAHTLLALLEMNRQGSQRKRRKLKLLPWDAFQLTNPNLQALESHATDKPDRSLARTSSYLKKKLQPASRAERV